MLIDIRTKIKSTKWIHMIEFLYFPPSKFRSYAISIPIKNLEYLTLKNYVIQLLALSVQATEFEHLAFITTK